MSHTYTPSTTSDTASTRNLLEDMESRKDDSTSTCAETEAEKTTSKPSSLWKSLKADNEARKAREVQYVSREEAERISGNGEQRVKHEEEERKRTGEKGGSKSLIATLL